MSGLNLDLSGASESNFDVIPSGTYDAVVFDVQQKATKGGPTAKLPAGTPMLSVQFKLVGGDVDNRRVFTNYVIAPEKIKDAETGRTVKNENKGTSDGILYGFLKALGYDPDAIKSGQFALDFDDMKGRECRVKVGQREYQGEMQNEVKGVKPAGSGEGASNDDLALLG